MPPRLYIFALFIGALSQPMVNCATRYSDTFGTIPFRTGSQLEGIGGFNGMTSSAPGTSGFGSGFGQGANYGNEFESGYDQQPSGYDGQIDTGLVCAVLNGPVLYPAEPKSPRLYRTEPMLRCCTVEPSPVFNYKGKMGLPGPGYPAGMKPDYAGVIRPDYAGVTRPNYGGGPRPDYGGGTRPDYGGGTRPDYGSGMRLDYGGGTWPDYGGGTRPDYRGRTRPDYVDGSPGFGYGSVAPVAGTFSANPFISSNQRTRNTNQNTNININNDIGKHRLRRLGRGNLEGVSVV